MWWRNHEPVAALRLLVERVLPRRNRNVRALRSDLRTVGEGSVNEEARREMERIIRDLKDVQAKFEFETQESGYLGEALCAVALALGRHEP